MNAATAGFLAVIAGSVFAAGVVLSWTVPVKVVLLKARLRVRSRHGFVILHCLAMERNPFMWENTQMKPRPKFVLVITDAGGEEAGYLIVKGFRHRRSTWDRVLPRRKYDGALITKQGDVTYLGEEVKKVIDGFRLRVDWAAQQGVRSCGMVDGLHRLVAQNGIMAEAATTAVAQTGWVLAGANKNMVMWVHPQQSRIYARRETKVRTVGRISSQTQNFVYDMPSQAVQAWLEYCNDRSALDMVRNVFGDDVVDEQVFMRKIIH